ncbi:MAG: alpha/beta fold hydrolase [Cyanobacteria bacterium J06607_13]
MKLPEAASGLTEATSMAIAQKVQWAEVSLGESIVATSYVADGSAEAGGVPLLLLHGFDSSLFEFRRLLPLLAARRRVYAVDLLGFGFCDRTSDYLGGGQSASQSASQLNPAMIRAHLAAFCEQVIGEPVVLGGASMGGGVAIDLAVSYPALVEKLVLIDGVGFAAGPAIGRVMFPPLDRWATNFLRNPGVRRNISRNAYYDKSFVTPDAELCASLHLLMPSWQAALIAFTKSGGYNFLRQKIPQISQPTLVLWGRQDKILGTKDAAKFEKRVPDCQLVWVEDCGHVPHLEQAGITADHIVKFLG